MSLVRKIGAVAALAVASQAASAASINNIGFESGFAGWTVVGTGATIVGGGQQFSGTSAAKLSGQTTLIQNILVNAGDKIDFMWKFVAGDYLPFNDFAFTVNGGGFTKLADVAQVGDYGSTGWNYFSWTASSTYSGPVSFSVVNLGDTINDSSLLLDATVPLPGAALLFGSALLGAGALRRKQAAAKQADTAAA